MTIHQWNKNSGWLSLLIEKREAFQQVPMHSNYINFTDFMIYVAIESVAAYNTNILQKIKGHIGKYCHISYTVFFTGEARVTRRTFTSVVIDMS